MSDIDPVEFGALHSEVKSLRREVNGMSEDIKHLVAMAERSRGALWAGMSIASLLGALVSWVAGHWLGKGP